MDAKTKALLKIVETWKLNKKPALPVNRKTFGLNFDNKFIERCKIIAKRWNTKANPVYKTFIYDDCGSNIYKAYNIWLNIKSCLAEVNFCQKCGHKLKLNKLC